MIHLDRAMIEQNEKWREITSEIPFLKFPDNVEVKVIPPFCGAMARFLVKRGDVSVSVYLDFYDNLGFVGEPYWEVYPVKDDTARFFLNETDDLMKCIDEALGDGIKLEETK